MQKHGMQEKEVACACSRLREREKPYAPSVTIYRVCLTTVLVGLIFIVTCPIFSFASFPRASASLTRTYALELLTRAFRKLGAGNEGGGVSCLLLLILLFDFSSEHAWILLIIAAMQTELLRISLASKLVSLSGGDKMYVGNCGRIVTG